MNPSPECPYLALRYFEERDSYLYYGRDEHVRELLSKLELNRFVAVLGSSGCGKSSLVRAGLLPELKSGMIPSAGHRWKVIEFKPGSSPMQELGGAFERGLGIPHATETIAEGPLGIARAVEAASLDADVNVLIIADQFEEIFSYLREEQAAGRGAEAREQALALVRRLLDAAAEPNLRIYVLMVMRSDYLGDCVQFPDLPERMNASLYLVPRLRRDQLQRAIEGPVGRDIEPAVVQRLLGEVGSDSDQLPRLEHLLSRMWRTADGGRITLGHYTAAGGWKGGLEQHLNQIYDGLYEGLAPVQQGACKLVFQRLSEMDQGRAVRRWATRDQLVALCGPEAEDVVNRFHREGFLRLSGRNQDTFDVIHESVLRGWPRLVDWMEEESSNVGRLRELVRVAHEAGWRSGITETGKNHVQGIAGLTLTNLIDWTNKFHPTGVWASRYLDAGEFETALDFLKWSEARRVEREKAAKAARLRTQVLVAAVLLVLLVAASAGLYWQQHVSRSYALAADSLQQRNTDPERGILLGIHAVNAKVAFLPPTAFAATALHSAIFASQVRMTLRGHGATVTSVAYSRDGRFLATGSEDKTAKIWDAQTGKMLRTLSGHTGAIRSVAFSPDSKRLVTGSDDKTTIIWDAEKGAPLKTLSGHTGAVTSVAFSPDSKRLATGSNDMTAKIWDAQTGTELMTLCEPGNKSVSKATPCEPMKPGLDAAVESVAFSPDGTRLATGSDDKTAKIWDAGTGKMLRNLCDPTDCGLKDNNAGLNLAIYSVAFSPNGNRLATGGGNLLAKIWDVETGKVMITLRGHESEVHSVAFSPDKEGRRLATAATDNTVRIWDAETGESLTILRGEKDKFESVAFSPDGKRVATGSETHTAKIWTTERLGTEVMTLRQEVWVTSVAFSRDGTRIATGSDDKTARIWDAKSGKELMTLPKDKDWVFCVAFSPDGKRLATASYGGTAKIWDAVTRKEEPLIILNGHTGAVTSIAYSPDGKLVATASADGTARIWNAKNGQLMRILSGHGSRVRSVAFSPDGTRLAIGTGSDDHTAKIWDALTGKQLMNLKGHTGEVYCVAFSPDGKRLATASADGTAMIWDAVTLREKPLLTLRGHESTVYSVAFSPDGTLLATGSDDQTAKIWDARSGKELATLRGHTGEVRSVAFSQNDGGKLLATASEDATVQLYYTDMNDLLALARTRATRRLTPDECTLYFGSKTCPKLQ